MILCLTALQEDVEQIPFLRVGFSHARTAQLAVPDNEIIYGVRNLPQIKKFRGFNPSKPRRGIAWSKLIVPFTASLVVVLAGPATLSATS
jgi:hypothetical protein